MDEIAFGTDGWRATLDTFTDERVRVVGQAVADYLHETGQSDPVAIGYDARETSPGFAESLAEVLAANGFDCLLPERDVPTPVVAWTVRDRGLSGALMVTASHNPPEYNGVKFIPETGAPALPEVTERIEANLRTPEPRDEHGTVTEADLASPYVEHALDVVDMDLSGLTVAYDAMHGSGRGVTDRLLDAAGADVRRLRCGRDPTFGGTSPEPTGERVAALVEAVEDGAADIGVANDGDADRLGVVTPERGYLDPNRYFAAVYEYLLDERAGDGAEGATAGDRSVGRPGDAVRTVSTTFLIDRVAEAHGYAAHETAVGFKWVAEAMREHDALVGGEESGGFGLRDHLPNKDGVLFALVTAAAEAQEAVDGRVDRVLDTHGEVLQDRTSVDCPDERKTAVVAALDDEIPDAVAGVAVDRVATVDGFKLLLADGSWLLVRPSGTEPKLRVYAEAASEERVSALLDAGESLVASLV